MMKTDSKRLLALLLALIIAICAVSSVSFSAAENDVITDDREEQVAAGEIVAEETVAEETAEEEPTETFEKEEIAEVAVDPATEAPTEAPTEPTVGKVKNLDRSSFDSDRCKLVWDAVPGADGYYVYYLNADKHKNYSKFADVKTNSCLVKPLKQGTQYHFKVSAYIKYNGKIIEGEKSIKKTATQPSKVTGLTKWRSSDVLELEWDRNPNATGYRIYRTAAGVESLYKTIYGNNKTSFSDYNVSQGRFYQYRIKSFRELYGTSYSSDASSPMMFRAGLCGPDYYITSRCQRVNLTWNRNPYATHYEIYYSTSSNNSSFTKLYTTTRTYFNTTKLTNGKTYYFRIRPIYVYSNGTVTGTSNKKSARVTASAYGYSTGSTYIEISIDQQHMWVYKYGSQIVSTDVVTGTLGENDTPTGYYSVLSKSTDIYLNGPGYSSFVNYWMAFIGTSYGIHDASWRSSYGYPIYKTSGSHGCVNTPYNAVEKIYYNIPTGTPVIIY